MSAEPPRSTNLSGSSRATLGSDVSALVLAAIDADGDMRSCIGLIPPLCFARTGVVSTLMLLLLPASHDASPSRESVRRGPPADVGRASPTGVPSLRLLDLSKLVSRAIIGCFFRRPDRLLGLETGAQLDAPDACVCGGCAPLSTLRAISDAAPQLSRARSSLGLPVGIAEHVAAEGGVPGAAPVLCDPSHAPCSGACRICWLALTIEFGGRSRLRSEKCEK